MREPSASTPSPEGASQLVESSGARPKLRRNRVILSCQQCHKRKQQCDRGHPCSRCVSRGCPDACIYEESKEVKKRKVSEPESESTSVPDLGQSNGVDSTNGPDPIALVGLDALLQVLQGANTNASNDVSTPSSDRVDFPRSPAQVSENAVQVAATALSQLSQQEAPDTHYPFVGMIDTFRGFGTQTPLSGELKRHFPNQKITAFLLSYYFDRSSSHWVFPVIHRPCFENCYRTFSSGALPPTLEFIALLAITCATALQFLPETDEDSTLFADYVPGRKVLEERLLEFSRCVLFAWTEYPLSSLERVQALALFAMYQWNDARAGESWCIITLAIRKAQTLSLNRDGATAWRMPPEEAEVRRRIWCKALSLIGGLST
ncbi:fungal-specific transcription factor domain-containing protein [Russula brevipes]|nr:fungal-specific transcription factor domain-containing protein [Russula brevipes]